MRAFFLSWGSHMSSAVAHPSLLDAAYDIERKLTPKAPEPGPIPRR